MFRRALMVFLLLALPLQFSWAAAAAYCLHGVAGHGAQHFGHHEHRHDAPGPHASVPEADSAAKAGTDGAGAHAAHPSPLMPDDDCALCHLGTPTPPALPPPAALAGGGTSAGPQPPAPRIGAPRPDRHERPNWRAA